MGLFIGNLSLGGGGIKSVDTLPEASEQEYNKHNLYLYNGDLYYLTSAIGDTPIIEEINTSLTSGIVSTAYGTKNNKVYKFAGEVVRSSPTNIITYYDIESNTETTLENTFPTTLGGIGSTQVGDYVYTFGGRTGTGGSSSINSIYKINLNSLNIELLNTTCQRGGGIGVCNVGNYIYIFGGSYSSGSWTYLTSIQMFDITTETITTLATQLINSNYAMTSIAIGTTIYLIGGTRDKNVYAFDTITQTITKVYDYALSRTTFEGFSAFNIDTTIYLVGGSFITGTDFSSDIYMFDTTSNTLTQLDQSFSHNLGKGPAVAQDNGTFYIVGSQYAEKFYFLTNYVYNKLTINNAN